MKVGSLVECIDAPVGKMPKWVKRPNPPVLGGTYTVREIIDCPVTGHVCIKVEEQVFGFNASGQEMAVAVKHFRELQPPMSLEFINEMQLETA